jgi:ribosomal-protein-alanine N-acetyltransferase
VPELQRLDAGHAPAVLAFELANRAYFAAAVSDRGDDFFDQFTDQFSALLAEQEAGSCACYLLVAQDGSVLGRFNLYRIEDGAAELGYRVAQHAGGFVPVGPAVPADLGGTGPGTWYQRDLATA